MDNVDELRIIFNPNDSTLPAFLEKHAAQTIIIYLKDEHADSLNLLAELYQKYQNFKLIIYFEQQETLKTIKSLRIPFFFANFVNDWDLLNAFLAEGVTDVYIGDSLGFSITDVARIVHKRGAAVRTIPNIAQSAAALDKSITAFFIRPEDIKRYEPYIDVFDFTDKNQEVYYKVYAIDGYWYGTLNEIIIGYEGNADSRYIGPEFAVNRLYCEKKCARSPFCKICKSIEELSTKGEKIEQLRNAQTEN
jgi:hypothetical protein